MKNIQTFKGFIAGGLLTLGLLFGLSTALAQFGSTDSTAVLPDMPAQAMMAQMHGRDFGLSHRPGQGNRDEHLAELAEALGVTVEELEAAHTAVMETERADRLEALADELGVTVAELEAAQETVREAQQAARLEAMIASGQLTEEEAALMEAHQVVRTYLDVEGMQASHQAFMQAAIDDALAAGEITAEQAEQLTTMLSEGGPGMGMGQQMGRGQGMGMGQGMNNGRGHGMGNGRGFMQP